MDVTPQLLREVEFREKFRGYDPDQVDELLERAGQQIAQLQGRLREALERADQAEARAATAGGGYSETEETLRRTLVLAQKTADAVVAEANEAADRTRRDADDHARRVTADADEHALRTRTAVDEERTSTLAEARVEARRLVAEAAAQADAIRSEAAAEARRVIESTRLPLREEIRELEQIRDQLQDDVAMLTAHVETQRDRIAVALAALQATVSDPSSLRVTAGPAVSAATLPAARDYGLGAPVAAAGPGAHDDSAAAGAALGVYDDEDDAGDADDAVHDGYGADAYRADAYEPDAYEHDEREPAADPGGVEPAPAPATFRPVLAEELTPTSVDLRTPEPWAGDDWGDEDDDWDDPPFAAEPVLYDEPTVSPGEIDEGRGRGDRGPATGEMEVLFADREPARGRDPFLDQLRQAVDDADDDTTRAMEAFFEPDDDDRRSRFGRRR